jgi:DNA helicase II / ATP-dependent DNA helicase PcrA
MAGAVAPSLGRCNLHEIAEYYRLKDAERPSQTAHDTARKAEEAAANIRIGVNCCFQVAKLLLNQKRKLPDFVGKAHRRLALGEANIGGGSRTQDLARSAKLVRPFRTTDSLAQGLASAYLGAGSYAGVSALVRNFLNRSS